MSHHTKLEDKLEVAYNFRVWKYRISLVLEENELDTYRSGEVPVPEGDETKALHKKNLVKAAHVFPQIFYQGSPYTTHVFPKDT